MKKLYTLLALVLTVFTSSAQIVNIPDANFKSRLLANNQINSNHNSEIEVYEALATYEISVNYANISTLAGIEAFSNLGALYCIGNQLTSLDLSNNTNLNFIECSSNLLTSLNIQNCSLLTNLKCIGNQLTSLNLSGNINLQNLQCPDNLLNAIDISPCPNLSVFTVGVNNLTTLDVSNNLNLTTFHCQRNYLTTVDVSNNTALEIFYCSENLLTSLDISHNLNLTNLGCRSNLLTSIDVSNNHNLEVLDCPYNNLNRLFIKNGANEALYFWSNPNLEYICADESELTGVGQQLVNYGLTNCHVNSYCDFNPGGIFYTLQGNTWYDTNANGCDNNDINVVNQKFTISNATTNGELMADNSGFYNIPLQDGTHTITPILENPAYFTISPASASVTFPPTVSPYMQNFCVTPNGNHNDLEVYILPIGGASPGFDAAYKIIYKNKGTHVQNGSVSLNFDDNVMDLITATPVIASQGTNTLNWNFTNLLPFEIREIFVTMNINSPTETPAVNAGNGLLFTATVNGAVDETPTNNTSTLNQTVVNSFDPNDKICLQGNTMPIGDVGKYLSYVIRFENTGTANAESIVVRDVIDTSKFEMNTLTPLSGSHSFVTKISNTNLVEFIFENINLPFDDANNDGYVAFKIKTKPTLTEGTNISNTADIYFDYNFPIITNTYTTTVFNPLNSLDFEFDNIFTLSPVPAKEVLNITIKQAVLMSSVSIYNTLGQLVQVNTNPNQIIDVSGLNAGSYFIKIAGDKGTASSKFIKE